MKIYFEINKNCINCPKSKSFNFSWCASELQDGNGKSFQVSSFSHQLSAAFEPSWRLAFDENSPKSFYRIVMRRHWNENLSIFIWIFFSLIHGRIFWSVTLITIVLFASYNTSLVWIRYLYNSTVITIDRDFLNRNITFPPITLCLRQRLNESAVEEFLM